MLFALCGGSERATPRCTSSSRKSSALPLNYPEEPESEILCNNKLLSEITSFDLFLGQGKLLQYLLNVCSYPAGTAWSPQGAFFNPAQGIFQTSLPPSTSEPRVHVGSLSGMQSGLLTTLGPVLHFGLRTHCIGLMCLGSWICRRHHSGYMFLPYRLQSPWRTRCPISDRIFLMPLRAHRAW